MVPNDAKAFEPVFKRAQAAGIPIITHESPDQQGNTWDIEMIDNQQFGELYMKKLAEYMGEEGEYMVVVGGLTVPLHNAWADFAIAYQKEHYPKMKLVADRFGVGESLDETKRITHDMILAHPNLKGVLIYGSSGVVGGAQAVKEAGKKDQIAVHRHLFAFPSPQIHHGRDHSRELHLESRGSGKSDRQPGETNS